MTMKMRRASRSARGSGSRGGRAVASALLTVACAWLAACSRPHDVAGAPQIWMVDGTGRVGGHRATVWGAPKVTDTDRGRAVCFDGKQDGLVVDANPIAGLAAFTLELLFRPDADGEPAARVLHISEEESEDRAMIETRMTGERRWYLDTFLHHGADSLALAQTDAQHAAGRWYWAALTYADRQMRHYVNGVLEASGPVVFGPLSRGRTSLGVRLNRVSWFKGCVRELRIWPAALPSGQLQQP
jgi:hypothetical protein